MNLYLATIKSVMYLMMMDQAMNSFTFPNLNVTDNYFYNIWVLFNEETAYDFSGRFLISWYFNDI